MFDVISLALPEVKLLTPSVTADYRGDFAEVYNERDLALAGISTRFVVDNHVRNVKANVVRGLHFQASGFAQAKLIRVTRGRILDVAVDLREGSPNFARHVAVELRADSLQLLYVPEGFAHGFSVLEDGSEVHYKVNRYLEPSAALGVRWDDPALAIDWRLTGPPILAERDMLHPTLAALATGAAGSMDSEPTTGTGDEGLVQDILTLEAQRCRALVEKDIGTLTRLFSEKMVYTHTSTRRDECEAFLRRVNSGFYEYKEFRSGPARVVMHGDTACVIGSLWSRVTVEGVEKVLDNAILVVWVRQQSAGWKMLAYQTTPIPAVVPT